MTAEEARERAGLLQDARYRVSLDLTSDEDFASESTIEFRCASPGSETFLDLVAARVDTVELNGRALPVERVHDAENCRVRLPGLAAENRVRVVATCSFHRTEMGMHRFADPADGLTYVHTNLEPFGAHRVFACFDQPDLKARFTFEVTAPADWVVVSNAPPQGEPVVVGDARRWTFEETKPISTYITAVAAGPFHEVRERHRDIWLGLYCRHSLAEHLEPDDLLSITKAGFDFYEESFGYPYAFVKYDQVFVPESNIGAMENAGCVMLNDDYLFRSRVTDAYRERRADTILHEMAHMWFGDLVTMRWWNDLWLNESFATYMANLAMTKATRFTEAWASFGSQDKMWAYVQDQLPTTHPIVAEIPDIESIYLNFDGITYAKGASVLRQLVAWVGEEGFLKGLKDYFHRHEYGNTTLHDFLAPLQSVSGRDLQTWSREWLQTPGVNTLRALIEPGAAGRIGSVQVEQTAPPEHSILRSHRLGVGFYDRRDGRFTPRLSEELDVTGARTEVAALGGQAPPDLLLLNDGDLTFAKVRLDSASLRAVVEHLADLDDAVGRVVCWAACWDMLRDGEMAGRDFVSMVARNAEREQRVALLQTLVREAVSAGFVYGDPSNREAAARELIGAASEALSRAEAGGDHQLVWARAFASVVACMSDPGEHLDTLRGLLEGRVPWDGLVVDTDLRWHLVRSLAMAGADGGLVDAEAARDVTDRGAREALAARAARPTAEAKEEAWRMIIERPEMGLSTIAMVMTGFQGLAQERTLEPFAERYFEALPAVWESREVHDALAFAKVMYPRAIVGPEVIEQTDRYLAGDAVPPPVRRLLMEGRAEMRRVIRTREVDATGE